MIKQTRDGVEIAVRVIPRARRSELAGVRGGSLLVRLVAPPVEGAANLALIALLANRLQVPARLVHIVGGEHARDKRVLVAGATAESVRRLLES